MKKIICFILLLLCPLSAWAERHIHLNGEHLTYDTILMMDQVFGYQVNDGYYWLNTQTGEWGYEESYDVQGTVQLNNQYQQEQQIDSYRESNNYYPTEINNSQNGSVVSGRVNGQNCTYASVGGMTMKSCD